MGRLRANTRRILLGFLGWAIILVGLVLIPFPGPGWMIVFIGFSVLAREFDWAKAAHVRLQEVYTGWRRWFDAQAVYIRALFGVLTLLTAAIIVWLVNGYGILNAWLRLGQDWLVSPFFRQ